MSFVLNILFSLAAFVIILGFIVIVHEFGHYIAGRLQGFAIEAFSIGFGPKIFEIKGRYNLWQFRWILLGGYVKFYGETGEEEHPEGESPAPPGPGRPFMEKKRWQRFIVMIMGVTFNVILAYCIFTGLASMGLVEATARNQPADVGVVAPNSPAAKAGIKAGDVIVNIAGRPVSDWNQAEQDIVFNQKPYDLTVERAGKRLTLHVRPEIIKFYHQPSGYIGVFSPLPPVVGAVLKPSPAYDAGMRPGDKIASMDGHPIGSFYQLAPLLAAGKGRPQKFTVERDGKTLDLTIRPEWDKNEQRYVIGINSLNINSIVRYPFPSNLVKGFRMTVEQFTLAFRVVKGLIERKLSLNAMAGPVSIVYLSGKMARSGLNSLLMFVAVISAQLAFFNLLPIPGLDGGQLLILLIEGGMRRDLPMIVKERIIMTGFALVILLFLAILFVDTAKFFH